MVTLDDIRPVIGKELDEFELRFKDSMKSSVPLLDKITYYLIKRRGKQLRPMLVFLSAGLHGKMGDSSYRAAALIELLHTATLVHDDVVDETYRRRGFFSINALWKNKVAVLVGDYLLSRGLLLAVGNKEFQFASLVTAEGQPGLVVAFDEEARSGQCSGQTRQFLDRSRQMGEMKSRA